MVKSNSSGLPIGYLLKNTYKIEKVIGQGGFGITYLAYDTANKEYTAVKELFPCSDVHRSHNHITVNVNNDKVKEFKHYLKRFEDEAKILITLNNQPNILKIKHFFTANNTAYIVMEYLQGMDLNSYYKKYGKMSWNKLSPYVISLLNSLEILHKNGLIHRDISPDNIFLTNDNRVVLIDFGSVRCYLKDNPMTTILKHIYAPYEQYRENGRHGPWTDIYSLSVTLYVLLTGKEPQKSIERAVNDKTAPISRICPALPRGALKAIEMGMTVMPENRIQSISEYRNIMFDLSPISPIRKEKGVRLCCIGGRFYGREWNIHKGNSLRMGRDTAGSVAFPADTMGVSRNHCALSISDDGSLCIKDEGSTYGTFVNGFRLKSGVWYRLKNEAVVILGNEKFKVLY